MKGKLVEERILESLDVDIRRQQEMDAVAVATSPADDECATAFGRHLLFSRWPALLVTAGLQLTDQELLYNSYYWMLRASKLYQRTHGYDAGFEQQVFMVLEQASCEFDWDVIEEITAEVEAEDKP